MTTAKVLVTGASGLLGRAILRAFEAQPDKFETYGTAFSRASGKLLKVNNKATKGLHMFDRGCNWL
jgi:S-adenosylmethionine synthetase